MNYRKDYAKDAYLEKVEVDLGRDSYYGIENSDDNTLEFGYRVYSSSTGTKAYEYYMFDFEYYKGSWEFTISGNGQSDGWSLERGLKKDIVRKILSYLKVFRKRIDRGELLVCKRLIKKFGEVS